MVKDDWVSAAMADDRLVAELLVRLKFSQAVSPLKSPLPVILPLRWGIRQPRSRTSMAVRCDAVFPRNNKDVDSSTRFSPTTPLSWSGGASPSATVDGYEESSLPASLSYAASRFKGSPANESTATAAKRLRRKKTFAELKEEESMLMKEKIHLKKELTHLRATLEEERAKNESLKKRKIDFNLKYRKELSTNCDRILASNPPTSTITGSDSCEPQNNSTEDCVFFLPDLNMIPSED